MRKTGKILTMFLALGICMSTMTCALGEEEGLGAGAKSLEIPKSVEAEAVQEAPKADAIAGPQAGTAAEAPAEQTGVQEKVEEKTEVGGKESAAAPAPNESAKPASGELTEIEDLETPLGLFDSNAGFTGTVEIQREGEGALYYGDFVTLTAQISNANRPFAIRWEVNRQDEEGWQTIAGANGLNYSFLLTKGNVDYEYRVVLVAAA